MPFLTVWHFQRVAERAARKGLDFETPAGEKFHFLGKRLGADVHQRAAAPAGGHFPVVAGALGVDGGGHGQRRRGSADFQKLAFFHLSPPGGLMLLDLDAA